MEKWKTVNNYENYAISTYGRLRKNNKIIKPIKCSNGYLEYALWHNGKRKVVLAHRLVAEHFIDNIDNLPEVNHKDENKNNNNVHNLEWCTSKYNSNYGSRNKKCRDCNKNSFKNVVQYDLNGRFVNKFECIADAARAVNGDSSFISRTCKGLSKTAYGYVWKFNQSR